MATDELTSISYTCGVNKSTVLVAEWYAGFEPGRAIAPIPQ